MSKRKKPENVHEFRTIEDLHAIPIDKIDHFVRDLALWLAIHKVADHDPNTRVSSPRDMFAWIDDGKHNVNLRINVKTEI